MYRCYRYLGVVFVLRRQLKSHVNDASAWLGARLTAVKNLAQFIHRLVVLGLPIVQLLDEHTGREPAKISIRQLF